jgi:hypothetical protein
MTLRIASELRASAARLRELASEGSYLGMADALRQVAAEFETEAKGVVASEERSSPNEAGEATAPKRPILPSAK